MTSIIRTLALESAPRRRHDARVASRSRDFALLKRLDLLQVDEFGATSAVERVCSQCDVPVPRLRFHARRSRFTGATETPRHVWVARLGEADVALREANGWGALPPDGAIRLGRQTTLMTVAHELGHHLVFHLDPPTTAVHGNRWVERFDQAAASIVAGIDAPAAM